MLFLKEIGLDCFSEEENFNLLANYVLRKGKPFYGYQGFYIYHSLGYAEIIAHVIPNEERQVNECIGFSSHVMGNNFWRLTIAEDGVMDDEGDSLSKCVFFHNPELENCVFPVHLVHADVLPSFMPGEKVTMQIQAFPYEIEYFKDEESYRAKHGVKMMGKFVDFKDGNILNMRIDDGCLIKATVKPVQTERSKEEWLELLRDWFNGNGEEDCEMIFYSGMLPDCELKLDNGDYISTFNDKESIFANIEVFANLPYKEIAVVKEIDKASILTMGPMRLTITTSEQGRIEEIDIYAPEM